MLISPQYRGQEQTGYTFETLVGITEPGVVFKDVFEFEFDVLKLAGAHLGCGYDYSEVAQAEPGLGCHDDSLGEVRHGRWPGPGRRTRPIPTGTSTRC